MRLFIASLGLISTVRHELMTIPGCVRGGEAAANDSP